MKKNVGSYDKIIRLLLAAGLIILFVLNVVSGVLAYIVLALAAILILTSLFSICPIWLVTGINTLKPRKKS